MENMIVSRYPQSYRNKEVDFHKETRKMLMNYSQCHSWQSSPEALKYCFDPCEPTNAHPPVLLNGSVNPTYKLHTANAQMILKYSKILPTVSPCLAFERRLAQYYWLALAHGQIMARWIGLEFDQC